MVVYVTHGVHFDIPYLPMSTHATFEGASKAAYSLVEQMMRAHHMTMCNDWQKALAKLRRTWDEEDVNVHIVTTTLQD